MNYSKVFVKRIISADKTIIAEAKSVAVTVGDNESTVRQTFLVEVSSNSSCSSSSKSTSTYK